MGRQVKQPQLRVITIKHLNCKQITALQQWEIGKYLASELYKCLLTAYYDISLIHYTNKLISILFSVFCITRYLFSLFNVKLMKVCLHASISCLMTL